MFNIILTVVIFFLLIFLHEFGHFVSAKASGVGVNEFSIGMGPVIFQKKTGETTYSLRALPIGGYCALVGEDEENPSPKAFGNQKVWKRFLVIASGATINLLLGFVIFLFVVGMQKSIITTTVESVDERSYAVEAGLLPGDKIVEINGNKVNFYEDYRFFLGEASMSEPVEVSIKRAGEKLKFRLNLSQIEEKYIYEEDGAYVITKINGIEEESYIEYSEEEKEAFSEYEGKEQTGEGYVLGVSLKRTEAGFKNIFPEAYNYTKFVVRMIFHTLGDVIFGDAGIEQFSGPVGVVSAVGDAVKTEEYAFPNILILVAMLTVNLGVFNLLPLPALDGGRLIFLFVEALTRKKVSAKIESMVHSIGMVLLLIFAAVVLFNDVLKLF